MSDQEKREQEVTQKTMNVANRNHTNKQVIRQYPIISMLFVLFFGILVIGGCDNQGNIQGEQEIEGNETQVNIEGDWKLKSEENLVDKPCSPKVSFSGDKWSMEVPKEISSNTKIVGPFPYEQVQENLYYLENGLAPILQAEINGDELIIQDIKKRKYKCIYSKD